MREYRRERFTVIFPSSRIATEIAYLFYMPTYVLKGSKGEREWRSSELLWSKRLEERKREDYMYLMFFKAFKMIFNFWNSIFERSIKLFSDTFKYGSLFLFFFFLSHSCLLSLSLFLSLIWLTFEIVNSADIKYIFASHNILWNLVSLTRK